MIRKWNLLFVVGNIITLTYRQNLELLNFYVLPSHFDAASIMYLQGYKSLALSNLFILQVNHLMSIEPGGYFISGNFYFEFIPICWLKPFLVFRFWLNDPTPAVRFIDSTGMIILWCNFYLPATDFGASMPDRMNTPLFPFASSLNWSVRIKFLYFLLVDR